MTGNLSGKVGRGILSAPNAPQEVGRGILSAPNAPQEVGRGVLSAPNAPQEVGRGVLSAPNAPREVGRGVPSAPSAPHGGQGLAALPETTSWPRVMLGDMCDVVLGGTPKTGNPEYWGGEIPWLTPGEMGALKSRYVEHTTRTLTEAGLAAGSRLFPARSVILSTRAPIGYVFINTVPMCTNQGCKTLVPKDCILPEYLYFNLLGRTEELNALGTGTTFKELATGRLQNLSLPLPPLPVQRDIVARLDAGLARADRMRERFLALAESASARFHAILAETFEQGANGDSWQHVKLGEVCDVLDSLRRPITKKDRKPGSIPYYGATGVVDYVDDFIFDEPLLLLGEDGAKWGAFAPSSFLIEGKAWVNNHAHVLRLNPELNRQFAMYYLNMADLSDYITGVTVPKLNQARMCEISIPLPPLPVQHSVVARLDAARTDCGRIEELARKGAEDCAALRSALLKETFE